MQQNIPDWNCSIQSFQAVALDEAGRPFLGYNFCRFPRYRCVIAVAEDFMKTAIRIIDCGSCEAAEQGPMRDKMTTPFLISPCFPTGFVQTFNTNGDIDLTGPFFQPFGPNSRNCGTRRQP
jgi:hypothetical protein